MTTDAFTLLNYVIQHSSMMLSVRIFFIVVYAIYICLYFFLIIIFDPILISHSCLTMKNKKKNNFNLKTLKKKKIELLIELLFQIV